MSNVLYVIYVGLAFINQIENDRSNFQTQSDKNDFFLSVFFSPDFVNLLIVLRYDIIISIMNEYKIQA